MTVITCPISGTWLVWPDGPPASDGPLAVAPAVAVHLYDFGWVCERCGAAATTTRRQCGHVMAVQTERERDTKAAKEVS